MLHNKGDITYSFIIPHYNVPSLLERCIGSIPEREDVEVIVVDDASGNPPRNLRDDVRLISLPGHRGPGYARNAGLEEARGRWVLFPDSDDFYNPGFMDTLDRYAGSDLQILFFSVDSRDSDTLVISERRGRGLRKFVNDASGGGREELENLLFACSSACHKMYSGHFLNERRIRFDEISINDDVLFSLNASYHAVRRAVITEPLYCVTYRPGSITYSRRRWNNYIDIAAVSVKRNVFYDTVGLKRLKAGPVTLLFGFDDPLKRRTIAEELCNCLVYALKMVTVLTVRSGFLYRGRKGFVKVITGTGI